MSSTLALTAREALDAFRGYVELALPTLSKVINAKPLAADGSRLSIAFPYATVERTSSRNLSATPHRRVGAEVAPADPDGSTHELALTRTRELVVEVKFYGDTGPDLAELLPTARGRLVEQAYLNTAGIAIRDIADVFDTRELRETVHEVSAMIEFAVVYMAADSSRVGTIETVNAMGYSGFDATYP